MPNSLSAKKRLKQNEVRRSHNRTIKSAVKTQVKKVVAAVTAGDTAAAETEFVLAAKSLDKAGAKKVFHKNTVARQKSRLQRLIKAAKA